jgi:hypothetical protein
MALARVCGAPSSSFGATRISRMRSGSRAHPVEQRRDLREQGFHAAAVLGGPGERLRRHVRGVFPPPDRLRAAQADAAVERGGGEQVIVFAREHAARFLERGEHEYRRRGRAARGGKQRREEQLQNFSAR